MRVGLVDIDRTGFPNLALMKLSTYHRMQGDEVLPLNQTEGADLAYASCVFSWHRERFRKIQAPVVIQGGPGIGHATRLPADADHLMPDYSLYRLDYSLGFTTRGCYRDCDWCVVPEMEGSPREVASFYEFWDPAHRRIRLLDNNLLAVQPQAFDMLEYLAIDRLEVDFTQGLDIRLVDRDIAETLARVRLWGDLKFAFDRPEDESQVRAGLRHLEAAGIPLTRLTFYVLFRPQGDAGGNYLRVRVLQEHKVGIFPMFEVPRGCEKRPRYKPGDFAWPQGKPLPRLRGSRWGYFAMTRRFGVRSEVETGKKYR